MNDLKMFYKGWQDGLKGKVDLALYQSDQNYKEGYDNGIAARHN